MYLYCGETIRSGVFVPRHCHYIT